MSNYHQVDKHNFLYHRYQYSGKFTPSQLVFNANLQEFSQRVGYICNLQTGGKLSHTEAYQQIEALWEQIKQSFQGLENETDAIK
ncbi:MAG: hypothetical protein KME21_20410 [Desmonostoc vinosum HA7617-LM4]|jgi:hypothetical protein|nr:hypothetical protein [Desmonostoc vinosum HA7617-LM4]